MTSVGEKLLEESGMTYSRMRENCLFEMASLRCYQLSRKHVLSDCLCALASSKNSSAVSTPDSNSDSSWTPPNSKVHPAMFVHDFKYVLLVLWSIGVIIAINGYNYSPEKPNYSDSSVLTKLVTKYERDGYVILSGLLDPDEIQRLRALIHEEISLGTLGPRVNGQGYYTSDASLHPRLKQIAEFLHSNSELYQVLSNLFGCNDCFRRLPRNDLMVDCAGAPRWHRDKIHDAISEYISVPLFDPQYHIMNVGFYFEDHSTDDAGLWVAPGSHKYYDMETLGTDKESSSVVLKSKLGDVIIWDWRTFHKGGYRCDSNVGIDGKELQHRSLFASSLGLKNTLSEVMTRAMEFKYQTETRTSQRGSISGCNGPDVREWRDCLVRYVEDELRLRPLSKEQQLVTDIARTERLCKKKDP